MGCCVPLARVRATPETLLSPATPASVKEILRVHEAPAPHWVGDGFPARSMFSYAREPERWSPFLLLDYLGPMEFEPTDDRRGVGPHPHRGFETVTILHAGEVEHRDSAGHHGIIGPGDVQWMTAASGVLHEEMQSAAFGRRGGLLWGAQVWVNLPAAQKMSPPRYQDLRAARLPTVRLRDGAGEGCVIAGEVGGELGGARGPATTVTPVEMAVVTLAAGGGVALALPEGHTALVLVERGAVRVNGAPAAHEAQLVELSRTGTSFRLEAETAAQVLVLGGEPIGEPVVGHGPFVMNSWPEISRAIHDVQAGRLGTL